LPIFFPLAHGKLIESRLRLFLFAACLVKIIGVSLRLNLRSSALNEGTYHLLKKVKKVLAISPQQHYIACHLFWLVNRRADPLFSELLNVDAQLRLLEGKKGWV